MVSNGSFGQYEDCDGDETLPVPVEARQDAPISVTLSDTLMATTPTLYHPRPNRWKEER
jgi:hypothetical protein